jgi:hypothetical protein
MDNAFRYIIDNKGIDTEASYPYIASQNDQCRYDPAHRCSLDDDDLRHSHNAHLCPCVRACAGVVR